MLNSLIDFLKYGNRKIYQFSPVRSGSTLVFNILKDLFPKHKLIKVHNIEPVLAGKYPVVITYRHPLDSLASTFQVLELETSDEELKTQIKRHKERGLDDLLILFENPEVLKLKYEAFYNDFEVIFSGIEDYFRIVIPAKTREKLKIKYQLDRVKKQAANYKDFSEFDKKTHWHGKHVSKFRGKPGYHLDFFNEKHLAFLRTEFRDYLEKLGY